MTASGAVLQHPSEAALLIGEKRETFCWCFKVTLKVANFLPYRKNWAAALVLRLMPLFDNLQIGGRGFESCPMLGFFKIVFTLPLGHLKV